MEYEDLVKAFADKYGISGLEIEGGVAAFDIDGANILLTHADSADFMTIYGDIGTPPPDANGPFGKLMLTSNYALVGTDGPILCMNPESLAYGIFYRLPLAQADVDALSARVEKLVNEVFDWKQVVNGLQTAEEEAAKQPKDSESISPFSSGPFIQV